MNRLKPMHNLMTLKLQVIGKVQGVCYRKWSLDTATEMGLAGWVRNLSDGSVELMVNGEKNKVDEFVLLCGQGPSLAAVSKVEVTLIDEPGHGGAFPSNQFKKLNNFDVDSFHKK